MARLLRIYAGLWPLLLVLVVTNGVLRDTTYGRVLDPLTAHQISSVTACLIILVMAWWAAGRWPPPSPGAALAAGALWLALTMAFETFMVRVLMGRDWAFWWETYDVTAGRLWPLVLLCTLAAPALARRLRA